MHVPTCMKYCQDMTRGAESTHQEPADVGSVETWRSGLNSPLRPSWRQTLVERHSNPPVEWLPVATTDIEVDNMPVSM